MDKHSDSLWNRWHSVWRSWRNAKAKYLKNVSLDQIGAHVTYGSDYYTLAGRVQSEGKTWFAKFLGWLAVEHVDYAYGLAGIGEFSRFTPDQIDVMTRIWVRTPDWYFGDYLRRAEMVLEYVLKLHPSIVFPKPHTSAQLYMSWGEIHLRRKNLKLAKQCFKVAETFIKDIRRERARDREQQLVRVLKGIALFKLDHEVGSEYIRGKEMIKEAFSLAGQVSLDQQGKILAELKQRDKWL